MIVIDKNTTHLNVLIDCSWNACKFSGKFLPCVKLLTDDGNHMFCSLEMNPKLKASKFSITSQQLEDFEKARQYVGLHYERLLEHLERDASISRPVLKQSTNMKNFQS